MCGLFGFTFKGSVLEARTIAAKMSTAINHRGPDNSGVWYQDTQPLVLGHTRLSILELSPNGAQPMQSACGRYVIVFNGEVYNHLVVRARLEEQKAEVAWRGGSDTETLLAAIAFWGAEIALDACVGMFAFALWDIETQTLILARDRFGEKPIYYGFAHGSRGAANEQATGRGPLLFASELKSLMAHPEWSGVLASDSLESYLRFGCVGGEGSIFQGVAKLPPGGMLKVTSTQLQTGTLPAPVRWWSAENAAREALKAGRISDPQQAVSAVGQALGQSVRNRMFADVPIGAFLSGGIDSSLITALMQQHAGGAVQTFSVGFDDARYDESQHAAQVAAHLGTQHTSLHATSRMALDLVPQLPSLYDEPFADSSQLPTALVARLTREHVTVALSGDGGDELFGGYNRHLWVPRIWRKLEGLPLPARRALARTLKAIPADAYDGLMRMGGRVIPARFRLRTFGEKLHKLAAVLESSSERELFAGVASMTRAPAALLVPDCRQNATADALFPALQGFNSVEWMLLMDTLHYMVDDVLVKVDRASMASSLEVRVPFLDPDVFHTAWRISDELKLRDGQGKWILRQLLYQYVPRELVDRPKMGFAVPLDTWLRGPLREWAEDLLSSASLADMPMLDAGCVRRLWRAHLKGQGHHAQQLWTVLQLLAWQRRWQPGLS